MSASLDNFNQTLSLRAEGSGECNLKVYLVKYPHIYDIFKVRVSSVVKPQSPVHLHIGGEVKFKVMDSNTEIKSETGGLIWSTNNPSILEINQVTGEAKASGGKEGRAEILLSNHINAASIVQISKVKIAEVDSSTR